MSARDALPRLVAVATEFASELHRTELPRCTCSGQAIPEGEDPIDVAGGGAGVPGIDGWCHTHRARYFASQLARELRALAEPVRVRR